MRRSPFSLTRLVALFCLLSLVIVSVGCSRTPHSKRWYEFWRKKPTLYNDIELYPPPDIAPPIDLSGPDTLPPSDMSIEATEPIRQEPTAMVSELQTIRFAYDSYALSPEMQDLLRRNAEWIRAHPGITIQVEGHCDERGSTEYNLSLGQKRADTVREFLAREGIDPQSLVTISYGEERPLPDAMGHDEEAWARNRRAQFLIY
ncbi:OmpA family protein [Candidatus Sumerlaeota bacterium]|nr:OmpA family protein [Candidatus Sumerlaeota bacterium]